MSRLLIVANDVVAVRMGGSGIRCFELGRAVQRAGHQVTLVGVGGTDLEPEAMTVTPPLTAPQMDELARSQDAVLLEGISLVRYPSLSRVPVPLIVDLYDPFPIALLGQEAHRPKEEQEQQNRQILEVTRQLLREGDFFLCASSVQRDLWTGALVAEGRVNPRTWHQDSSLRQLIEVVPFGLPEEPPAEGRVNRELPVGDLAADDIVLVWGGGIYNWFDPLTLIRAVGKLADQKPPVKLIFMSTEHPNAEIPEKMWMTQSAIELSDELGLTDRRVFFNRQWVPYHERSRWLAAADCGVSTHFDNAETRYAFRTRILDYLWAQLPIICTAGDHFAQLVAERELGWVVPAQDVEALVAAIQSLATDPDARRRISERVGLEAQYLSWDLVAKPLCHFLDRPRMAADEPRRTLIEARRQSPIELRFAAGTRLLRRGVRSWSGAARGRPAERCGAGGAGAIRDLLEPESRPCAGTSGEAHGGNTVAEAQAVRTPDR